MKTGQERVLAVWLLATAFALGGVRSTTAQSYVPESTTVVQYASTTTTVAQNSRTTITSSPDTTVPAVLGTATTATTAVSAAPGGNGGADIGRSQPEPVDDQTGVLPWTGSNPFRLLVAGLGALIVGALLLALRRRRAYVPRHSL